MSMFLDYLAGIKMPPLGKKQHRIACVFLITFAVLAIVGTLFWLVAFIGWWAAVGLGVFVLWAISYLNWWDRK